MKIQRKGGQPLKKTEIAKLWRQYQKTPHARTVGEICHVSEKTVSKYKKLGRWDERLAAIEEKAAEKLDESIAEIKARWAQQGRELQRIGLSKFFDEEGNLKKDVVKNLTVKSAITAIVAGQQMERDALGSAIEQPPKLPPLLIQFIGGNGQARKQIESVDVSEKDDGTSQM